MSVFTKAFVVTTCILIWAHFLISVIPLPCPEGSVAIIANGNGNWCVVGTPWRDTPIGKAEWQSWNAQRSH